MRSVVFAACTLALGTGSGVSLRAQPVPMSGDHLASKVQQADAQRGIGVGKVTSARRYVLRNHRWSHPAVMHARVVWTPGQGKQFEILSMENSGGLQKRVFKQVLEGEAAVSRKQEARTGSDWDTTVSANNYNFVLLGHESLEGRQYAVLQITPKRKSKYLIKGKAWVDVNAAAIVRVEGHTAASVSFFIGKPLVVQQFRKVDEMWLPSSNRTVSDVRFLGDTEMTIEYLTYTITPSEVKAAGAYKPRTAE